MNSFTEGSAFCPGAPKRVPSDSEKHRRVYTSSNVCHSHEWRVDTASGKTLKKRNACLHAVRQAVEKQFACLNGLRSEGVNKPSSEHIRKLLELILNRNCFQFGNKFYLQKIGCAMGSTASPKICDITLHDLENKIPQQADHILTWWRYRDDIRTSHTLYSGELEHFKNLINTMNQMHPTLKFTYEASKTSIDYMYTVHVHVPWLNHFQRKTLPWNWYTRHKTVHETNRNIPVSTQNPTHMKR